jgi:hypothetical protein
MCRSECGIVQSIVPTIDCTVDDTIVFCRKGSMVVISLINDGVSHEAFSNPINLDQSRICRICRAVFFGSVWWSPARVGILGHWLGFLDTDGVWHRACLPCRFLRDKRVRKRGV